MIKETYKIIQEHNFVKVYDNENHKILFSSYWFMEFGKNSSEIKNNADELLYSISKKFQFWRWRMAYLIQDNQNNNSNLLAQNLKNTIFKIEIDNALYEIRMHYQKRKSIFKNDKKIAEIDESFSDDEYKTAIKLTISKDERLKIPFLLITCLLIGEVELHNKSSVIKSQKELEKNDNPWT